MRIAFFGRKLYAYLVRVGMSIPLTSRVRTPEDAEDGIVMLRRITSYAYRFMAHRALPSVPMRYAISLCGFHICKMTQEERKTWREHSSRWMATPLPHTCPTRLRKSRPSTPSPRQAPWQTSSTSGPRMGPKISSVPRSRSSRWNPKAVPPAPCTARSERVPSRPPTPRRRACSS